MYLIIILIVGILIFTISLVIDFNKNKYLIVISILLILIISLGIYSGKNQDFNSLDWKSKYSTFVTDGKGIGTFEPLSERKNMVKSLIKSKQVLGKTKEEAIEVLGQEDNDFESDRWSYWLYFTAVDNGWLVLTFNKDGVVDNVFKYED